MLRKPAQPLGQVIRFKKRSRDDKIREILKERFIGTTERGDELEIHVSDMVSQQEREVLKQILEAEEVGED